MGVYFDKRKNKYVARSKQVNGKREYLGAFDKPLDAKNAYKEWDMQQEMTRLLEAEKQRRDSVENMSSLHVMPVDYIADKPTIFGITLTKVRKFLRDCKAMKQADKDFDRKMREL